MAVQIPRVRDRSDSMDTVQLKSSLIPPYMRRTATLNEVLPLLYLKGISEIDFVEALSPIFGDQIKNLLSGVISQLKSSDTYWWVDGIGFSVRNEERHCVLVIIGVDEYVKKELIALEDVFRESTESWLSLL